MYLQPMRVIHKAPTQISPGITENTRPYERIGSLNPACSPLQI